MYIPWRKNGVTAFNVCVGKLSGNLKLDRSLSKSLLRSSLIFSVSKNKTPQLTLKTEKHNFHELFKLSLELDQTLTCWKERKKMLSVQNISDVAATIKFD